MLAGPREGRRNAVRLGEAQLTAFLGACHASVRVHDVALSVAAACVFDGAAAGGVNTVVSVVVVVDVAEAVVAPMVIVVGCGFRQLQARESFHAGWWRRFFLVKSTQLGAALAIGVEAIRVRL
jgi:hypothetical protein